MNKTEYIENISKLTGFPKSQCNAFVNAGIDVVTKALKRKDSVQLTGFGTWSLTKHAARMGRNPATGKSIKIAACVSPKFKAGSLLKKAVK